MKPEGHDICDMQGNDRVNICSLGMSKNHINIVDSYTKIHSFKLSKELHHICNYKLFHTSLSFRRVVSYHLS